jgi:hypothetical protein
MLNAQISTMPMELRPKLMTIISLDSMDVKRKLSSGFIYKISRILFALPVVNMQQLGSGGIIYCMCWNLLTSCLMKISVK